MNYTWQYPKRDGSLSDLSWKLVYSTKALATLNENNLNESLGLDPQLVDYPDPVLFPYSNSNGTVVRIGIIYPNSRLIGMAMVTLLISLSDL